MLSISLPKPNEVVGLNETFAVVGSVTAAYLDEVTVQLDNGPVRRAAVSTIGHVQNLIFTAPITIAAGLGNHGITVKAIFSTSGTETQTVTVQALGEPE